MNNLNARVTQLPPTLGIKDPEVRSFLDALTSAWDHRSGTADAKSEDRFITAREFRDLANNAVVEALASATPGSVLPGVETGGGGGSNAVSTAVTSLSDEIKRSILYQLLGTEFESVNISEIRTKINDVFSLAESYYKETKAIIAAESEAREEGDLALTSTIQLQATRIGQAEAAIVAEANTRTSQYQATTQTLNTQASRISAAESAIISEATTRTNKDNALAASINRIWASIGNNNAGIEDQQLASVTPVAAQATKWDQVQVAVRDPNTGLPSSTSIKQELTSYANLNDGTLNSIYSVRAQVVSGGRTIVGGFGLAATNGAGSGQGPRIAFGVRADEFWVGNLSGVGDIPFIIQTSSTTINGVTRPPGVYIKDAFIANGTIDNAKIANASIDTLKIGGGQVTSMTIGTGGGGSVSAGGSTAACSLTINMPAGSSGVAISANVAVISVSSNATVYLRIQGSNGYSRGVGISLISGFYQSTTIFGFDPFPSTGNTTYTLYVESPTSGPGANQALQFASPAIQATGGKR